jgi:hypothetical protein
LSFKDPDVVPIMLKQLEVQLELMLIRIKKSQQRDFSSHQGSTQTYHDLGKRDVASPGQAPLARLYQENFLSLARDRSEVSNKVFEFESDLNYELYGQGESVQGEYNPRVSLEDETIVESEGPIMKTTRIREKIKKFLSDRPRNADEILAHINSTMRHGSTAQQLGNILSKDKDFVQVGYIKRSGILSGGYDIQEWATRIWVSSNCPGWQEGTPITIDDDGNVTTSASTD